MQQATFQFAVGTQGKTTNGLRDPAFTENRQEPLHRWVPWIAGFSANFVRDCLAKYLQPVRGKQRVWVLDPFAGVGTTLVEAFLQGFNVVGFEINPYAALAAELKLEAAKVSTRELRDCIHAFERFMERRCGDRAPSNSQPRSKPPVGFSGRMQLFSARVERKVLFALDFISGIQNRSVRDLFRLAFGSVMVSVSNYSYEPSLTRRLAVDKPEVKDADIAGVLSAKVREMLADIQSLQARVKSVGRMPEGRVFPESIFSADKALRKRSFVDLVITSPPYLNNYHYPRNTRPQLHWLGFASGPGYNGAREQESFGKFWQTVRDLPPVDLSFPFRELQGVIERIRDANAAKGPYGGPGWANYAATYFNDAYRFCKLLATLLRPNGVAMIVLGNSIIQGIEIKTDYFFGKTAELSGLKFEETILLRQKRTGSSIIDSSVRASRATARTALYESGIVLRRQETT